MLKWWSTSGIDTIVDNYTYKSLKQKCSIMKYKISATDCIKINFNTIEEFYHFAKVLEDGENNQLDKGARQ